MARGTLGPPIALPVAELSTPQSSAVTLAAYRPDSARHTGRRSVSSGPLPGAHLWQSGGSPERRRRAAPARSPKLRQEDESSGHLHLPGLELQLGGSVVTAASVLAGSSSGKSAAAAAALDRRVSQREQKLHHIQEKHDLALRRRAAAMGRHTIDHAEMFLSKEPPSLLARAPRSCRDRAEPEERGGPNRRRAPRFTNRVARADGAPVPIRPSEAEFKRVHRQRAAPAPAASERDGSDVGRRGSRPVSRAYPRALARDGGLHSGGEVDAAQALREACARRQREAGAPASGTARATTAPVAGGSRGTARRAVPLSMGDLEWSLPTKQGRLDRFVAELAASVVAERVADEDDLEASIDRSVQQNADCAALFRAGQPSPRTRDLFGALDVDLHCAASARPPNAA